MTLFCAFCTESQSRETGNTVRERGITYNKGPLAVVHTLTIRQPGLPRLIDTFKLTTLRFGHLESTAFPEGQRLFWFHIPSHPSSVPLCPTPASDNDTNVMYSLENAIL